MTEIISGKAIHISLPWRKNLKFNILAVYAPNDERENEAFTKTIKTKLIERNMAMPDIILGDFNIVLDPLDRIPQHADNLGATNTLTDFLAFCNLKDGWRQTYPDTKQFSYLQKSTSSQSWID